jgi:DNA-binding NarL/FixJ family response regulator
VRDGPSGIGLVGRNDLVARILGALEDGRRPVVVLAESGMGKSAVLRAVVDGLPSGAITGAGQAPLDWQPYLALRRSLGPSLPTSPQEAARQLIERAGRRPIVVDDVHWCDPDSIAMLEELVTTHPVLLAMRPGYERCEDLCNPASATVVALEPLADDEATALARQRHAALSEQAIRRIVDDARGCPLLLELGEGDRSHGADRVAAEVARLSAAARRALVILALASDPERAEIGAGVEHELRAAGLILDGASGRRLRHDAFGVAAVSMVDEDVLEAVHTELAERAASAGDRARHLLAAGLLAEAAEAAATAASSATTEQERAAHLLVCVRARGAGADDVLLVEAAEALARAFRPADVVEITRDLRCSDPALELHAAALCATAAWTEGDYDLAEAAIERGLAAHDVLGTDGDDSAVDLLVASARIKARVRWDGPSARASAERALDIAQRTGMRVGRAFAAKATASLVAGTDEWRDALERAIEHATSERDEFTVLTSADTFFMAELMAGDTTHCASIAADGLRRCEDLGLRRGIQQMSKNLALAKLHVDGDIAGAAQLSRVLLEHPLNPRTREHLESTLAIALAELGEIDAAEDVLHDAIGWDLDETARSMVLWSRTETDWSAGRLEAALEHGARCRDLAVGGFPAHVAVEPIRQWAAVELDLDPGTPMPPPHFGNLLAASLESAAIVALHGEPGDPSTAGLFLEAAEAWSRTFRRYEARARWGAGEAARRAGDLDQAVALLEPLAEQLRACGRVPLLRRCLASLRLCGRRLPRPTPAPVAPFSGGEVEVLELVARGLDSRAIARRLGLGVATVETLVRSAMQRVQAPTRLAAAHRLVTARSETSTASEATVVLDPAVYRRMLAEMEERQVELADLPDTPWDLSGRHVLAVGRLCDRTDRDRALLAGVRGAHLVVEASGLAPELRAELLAELNRTGAVEVLEGPEAEADLAERFSPDVHAAAAHLAAGCSVADVAHRLSTSVRTLHRQLAGARAALGVSTNAELVQRLGLSGPPAA